MGKILGISIFLIISACASDRSVEEVYNFELIRNHIYLPVSMDKSIYKFLLDTGATGCSISKKVFEQHKFKIVGAIKYAGAQRIWSRADIVEVKNMKIGDTTLDVIKCAVNETEKDGIIGMDVIRDRPIYIDLLGKTFSFESKYKKLKNKVPFILKNESDILISVKINDKEIHNLIFDTGGSTNLSDDLVMSLKLPRHSGVINANGENEIERVVSVDATGNEEESFYHIASVFCVASECKKNQKVLSVKYHKFVKSYKRNGMLGLDFFSGYKILIDIKNNNLFFER